MKFAKKLLAIVTASAMCICVLAACGSTTVDEAATETPVAPATELEVEEDEVVDDGLVEEEEAVEEDIVEEAEAVEEAVVDEAEAVEEEVTGEAEAADTEAAAE